MSEKNLSSEELLSHFFNRLEDHIVAAIRRSNAGSPQESRPSMMTGGNEKQLMTVQEVADLLSMSVGGVYTWVAAKKIPHTRIGGWHLRFNRAEIKAWANANSSIVKS